MYETEFGDTLYSFYADWAALSFLNRDKLSLFKCMKSILYIFSNYLFFRSLPSKSMSLFEVI